MPKEQANPYFGRKSFGGKGLGPSKKPASVKSTGAEALRKKYADRCKVVAIVLGAKSAPFIHKHSANVSVVVKAGKQEVVSKLKISITKKGYEVDGTIAIAEGYSVPFKGAFRSFTAMARGHIARQVAVLKKAKESKEAAFEIASNAHINKLITRANAFIEKSDAKLDPIPKFEGNATARPQYERASVKAVTNRRKPKVDPWSDPREEVTAGVSELFNPLLGLIHEKMKPDMAPLSPTGRKPMIVATVGPVGGPSTRVWISTEERVCLPRLASKPKE
jgi:hypothetical protein